MEILDIIIDTHGLIYRVQTQNGNIFEHTLANETPPDKVAQVLRLLATHVDQLEAEKAKNN
ncbi:hypothetical protein E2558_03310 [Staphylococcus pragensis]|uniref:Phage protein n=1 Tax=Staphylococcus pragensis TaxID=1611836 RepID=A0A4Z1BEQ6_9STAP|nr:hypothetical protein [Staphylococcus pragensis]RTX87381.1 hypothetical protein CD154_10405 [Staphylococcus carnosus]TGN28678.1 hypothetical protein E2558_03310 [Staphylococcus pragensis]GGG85898.1 hypothetical protein GCM10007342_04590 [Staphylococcus pragensis]